MAVIVDVIDNDVTTTIVVGDSVPVDVTNTINETIDVTNTTGPSVVVEVPQGLPGVQNLYVGYTPPSGPQEGWVWIDLNG